MVVYLLSIAVFVLTFIIAIKERGLLSKCLLILSLCFAGYDIYSVFTNTISDLLLVKLLLSILPIVAALATLIFLVYTLFNGTKTSANGSDDGENSLKKSDKDESRDEPISYKDEIIEDFGSCDVEETEEFIKITMKSEGKAFEFYVKDSNIVAFRSEGMIQPQEYKADRSEEDE